MKRRYANAKKESNMKAIVVYDSMYGNTQQIAEEVGRALGVDTRVVKVGQLDAGEITGLDLLVVGSPTLGGRATEPVQAFLANLQEGAIKGLRFATFDTRYTGKFVKIFGFAADRIAQSLSQKGGIQGAPPEAFYVTGKRGPLKEGELERAATWAKGLVK